jgi:hypothetical protein
MKMTEANNGNSRVIVSPSAGNDIPGIVAVAIANAPGALFRSGWTYLRTKRRARKSAKIMAKTMQSNGVPPDVAQKLADKYESDISVSNLMRTIGVPFGKRSKPEEPGK